MPEEGATPDGAIGTGWMRGGWPGNPGWFMFGGIPGVEIEPGWPG